ncbi:MAG: 2-nitropropane dioxygenase [Armatimonadetes bacterium CG_4_10_14_3_um_filter_66_18]|nr:nitronate monooxygenase [Armatimonadota bacterium]OIO92706.1 MAG: 2-nitropropane dioxygenase [Armatimonadetes bacterium CG2_30_66_41]PIU94195.1 MAG: 2-nitropropane dioxygenase [Armatimonadetes bacterium CG06_land_8_20_14_3_00_66_21]PIX38102.1 MAG: 2-nitropropane dioxygenase [Armatimonadetes bacterium CG_4_8_14_3_um_filter_66_20]PIY53493.1 MAG: 2-nitropropane dioxygenase [Armatimonadetes bacterium CG_4_10_14_3_um_filter_66_18]PIZ48983.1 MAG: 2-nitropropane dioxygenase [Armatimonadetes bacter
MTHPAIIQGGMGAGVSNWFLARAVAETGQLGVVSGTALDVILARRLQDGDPDGHMRRALSCFPVPSLAQRIVEEHCIPGGRAASQPFRRIPAYAAEPSVESQQLTVVANFVEVFLAKEGHDGVVGINYLEKIQMPNLASLYGAMLAGVDYVCMGAGVPREIPGILDRYTQHQPASLRLLVEGATGDDDYRMTFDPTEVIGGGLPPLPRPLFLAIIASAVLAQTLAKKATGKVDGFVIEGPTAGGHNAPPRGLLQLSDSGEPIYGPKDDVDLKKIAALGVPFWLAGGYGEPPGLEKALALGAVGIQVGTAFALCRESALTPETKQTLIGALRNGESEVFTDPVASPTGFPFKVARLEGSLSEREVYENRKRVCDLGYLRHVYRKPEGSLGYRCPAEPVNAYERKGGKAEQTLGRKCLCNGLLANIGIPQCHASGYVEKMLLTAGDDLKKLSPLVEQSGDSYSARDVVKYLLGSG